MSAAERFAALFSGYSRAHGKFIAKNQRDERGKEKGRSTTVTGAPDFNLHLRGEASIGSIPLRDDDTVLYGAIDVDKYNGLLIASLHEKVRAFDLPLVCCETKSKGVHLYLFLREPHDPDTIRRQLSAWAAKLGVGGSEIFPKQSHRVDASDCGNYINSPYFKGLTDAPERCAWNGERFLSLDEFLDLAESKRTTIVEAQTVAKNVPAEFDGAPPCLCYHATSAAGVPEGHRHNELFSLITFCRKKWPDDWQKKVHELNGQMFKPPLSYNDIEKTLKSVARKDYDYECKGAWCDKKQCRRAEFGRGETAGGESSCEIGSVTKIVGDPVFWIIELDNGVRVKVLTDDLLQQSRFNKVCMERLNRCPIPLPQPRWLKYLDEKIRDADTIESPVEATPAGIFVELVEHWLSSTSRRALHEDEVLIGKPYYEEKHDAFVFKGSALFEYLDERRFRYENRHQVWHWLGELLKARSAVTKIKGKSVNVWVISANALKNPVRPDGAEPINGEVENG